MCRCQQHSVRRRIRRTSSRRPAPQMHMAHGLLGRSLVLGASGGVSGACHWSIRSHWSVGGWCDMGGVPSYPHTPTLTLLPSHSYPHTPTPTLLPSHSCPHTPTPLGGITCMLICMACPSLHSTSIRCAGRVIGTHGWQSHQCCPPCGGGGMPCTCKTKCVFKKGLGQAMEGSQRRQEQSKGGGSWGGGPHRF